MINGWKNWTAKNHIKEPINNENAVYYAHKWIQIAFPESSIEVLGLNQTKSPSMDEDSSYYENIQQHTTTLSNFIKTII